MTRHSSARPRARPQAAALLLSLLIGALAPGPIFGQDLETERWRTPMRVDRTTVPADLIVEFAFERLETPLVEYDPGEDTEAATMSRFALALAEGDIDEAIALTAEIPGTSREDSRDLLQAFSDMFSDAPEAVRLERTVHLGRERLLVWSLPMENGQRFYRSFRFMREDHSEDAPIRYEGVLSEPVSSLLTQAFQVGQEEGPDPRDPESFEYKYIIPATEEQPVRFLFDGQPLDVDAFDPLGETGIQAVDFYTQAMDALANGEPEDYAALFTDYSQGRYVQWAAEQGSQGYEAFREDMLQMGARIVFVLEADPLYLIYHTPTDPAVTGAPLRYSAVYKDPENGFRLANFYVHGLADTFLQRREYFEEPFLRPLLAQANIMESPRETEGAVASADEPEPPDPDELLADWEPETVGETEEPRDEPPADVEDLAGDEMPWLWIVGGALLLALVVYRLLAKRP